MIVGLVSAITSKYDVSMGIAIPITALIIKTGIINFYGSKTLNGAIEVDIKEIVKNKAIDK